MALLPKRLALCLIACCVLAVAPKAEEKEFSIPFDVLKDAAENITISMDMKLTGRSGVHPKEDDCEMHFGAKSSGYTGDPSGIVVEPMNVCVTKAPTGFTTWPAFGDAMIAKTSVKVTGVPRFWPEHLDGHQSPSNPNHGFEIHPATKIKTGNKTYDLTSRVYAPSGYDGGVSESTAINILNDVEVTATKNGSQVDVAFDSGRIGNFTSFELTIKAADVETIPGGHRMWAQVTTGKKKSITVRAISISGTKMDALVAGIASGKKSIVEALVLFSLDPKALFDAVAGGNGSVGRPIQLILFGELDDD